MKHYQGPSIDQSLLSPSGRMSGAARRRALARETERLFPPGFWDQPATPDRDAQIQQLRRHAQDLLDLADRGMQPRAYRRAAERLLARARAIEQEAT